MKIRILPSSPDASHLQHLISFVVDDQLAIDAGCIGLCGSPEAQARLTTVLLTHSHLDHICSLPIFAMNVLDSTGRGCVVTAPVAVIESLQRDVFNKRVWPDFGALALDGQPLVRFVPIEPRRPITIGGYTITAVPLNHPVPTVAYLVDDGLSAALFALDTGRTDEVWAVAARHPRLTVAFVDVAFPDDMAGLAEASGHLTPALVREQVSRLPEAVKKIALHLKPAYHHQIVDELAQAAVPNLTVGRLDYDYSC